MAKATKNQRAKKSGGVTGKGFKPGKSGNPSGLPGRPKGETLTDKIRRVLDEPDADHGTKADRLIAMAVQYADAGDFRYFKEILERVDGKVADRVANADGSNLAPIKILNGVSMSDL